LSKFVNKLTDSNLIRISNREKNREKAEKATELIRIYNKEYHDV